MSIKHVAFDFAMESQATTNLKQINRLFEKNLRKFDFQNYLHSNIRNSASVPIPKNNIGKIESRWYSRCWPRV